MRHNKHHASLGVTVEHRRAMMSNLATALITHGRIETTLAKAKALRPFIEKVITKAKKAAAKTERKDAIHLRRLALSDVRDETAITKLFNETHKEFTKADDPGYKKSKGKKAAKGKKTKAPKAAADVSAEASAKAEATPAPAPETKS